MGFGQVELVEKVVAQAQNYAWWGSVEDRRWVS